VRASPYDIPRRTWTAREHVNEPKSHLEKWPTSAFLSRVKGPCLTRSFISKHFSWFASPKQASYGPRLTWTLDTCKIG